MFITFKELAPTNNNAGNGYIVIEAETKSYELVGGEYFFNDEIVPEENVIKITGK